jgi:hypothetical protein
MTDEEIEAVAQELAKIGGLSWYPGRTDGPLLRPISERYRDRARVAIAALDRVRAGKEASAALPHSTAKNSSSCPDPASDPGDRLEVGAVVVYRPPGDQRAVTCRIDKMDEGRAYLVPCPRPDFGWVSLEDLSLLNSGDLQTRYS